MKASILYVEDDVNLGFVTKDNLELAQFSVTHCLTGTDALDCFEPGRFDLCLLDVMLPQTDGFALARHIRSLDTHVPILFLSALNGKDDRLQGLRLGADDYLTKPFSIEELLLKIEVFLKRTAYNRSLTEHPLPTPPASVVAVGSYRFDPTNHQLIRTGQVQLLTQREADVLAYLLARPNTLVRRDDILRAIWGDNDYFMGRSLDVFISRPANDSPTTPTFRLKVGMGSGLCCGRKLNHNPYTINPANLKLHFRFAGLIVATLIFQKNFIIYSCPFVLSVA